MKPKWARAQISKASQARPQSVPSSLESLGLVGSLPLTWKAITGLKLSFGAKDSFDLLQAWSCWPISQLIYLYWVSIGFLCFRNVNACFKFPKVVGQLEVDRSFWKHFYISPTRWSRIILWRLHFTGSILWRDFIFWVNGFFCLIGHLDNNEFDVVEQFRLKFTIVIEL